MRSIGEIGLKITGATREYYRYTGISAEMERKGAGCSRPELAWANRSLKPEPALPPAEQAAEVPEKRESPVGRTLPCPPASIVL